MATYEKDIVNGGFGKYNIRHVKLEIVPAAKMGHWIQYDGEFFENAVQFLDASLKDEKEAAPVAEKSAVAPAASGASPAAPTVDDKSAAAARQLSLAKSYIAANRLDAARTRLQSVIDNYPTTPAAAEAKSLLAKLDAK
jgi:TolA-binding protein